MIPSDAELSRFGRCERIRTSDPFVPNEVRYQAAPHTDFSRAATISKATGGTNGLATGRGCPGLLVDTSPTGQKLAENAQRHYDKDKNQ